MKQHRSFFSTTQLILLSFLAAILLGTALLALPFSAADGRSVPIVDALFTATTSVCVTGLTTLPTVSAWSPFGQAVILLLIQVGGLGIITTLAGVTLLFQRRMGLGDRLLLQDTFNLNTLSGLVRFLKKALLGTFAVEGVGALLCMTVFVPRYGPRGVWISVFHAVSAFCNAGMDVFAQNSLIDYALHPLLNTVTCVLILLGGVGFLVWWDVLAVLRQARRLGFRCLQHLTLHSKIVLWMTSLLLAGGTAAFFLLEYHNPATLGGHFLPQKLLLAFFQSVTCRTAGFATIPQSALTDASALVSLLLMFIGGSPVGTAGGVKTVTVAVLAASAYATIRNRDQVCLFHRALSPQALNKALAVVSTAFAVIFLSALLLSVVTQAPTMDILYEVVSASATVGLSRDLTPALPTAGKLIVTATMYLGRVGPISLAVAFGTRRETRSVIQNPTEEISVG